MDRRTFALAGTALLAGHTGSVHANGAVAAIVAQQWSKNTAFAPLIYTKIEPAQPVDLMADQKNWIELRHFFSYASPACASTEGAIAKWKKPWSRLSVLRIGTALNEKEKPLVQLCFAVEKLPFDTRDTVHASILDAVHKQRTLSPSATLDEIAIFLDASLPSHAPVLKAALMHPDAQAHTANMARELSAYNVVSVPSFVVHGKYLVDPAVIAKKTNPKNASYLYHAVFDNLDRLIFAEAKVRSMR